LLNTALGLLLCTGFYPLWFAWRANQRTTLRHAILWAAFAWIAWIGAALLGPDALRARYLALSLTGCAGVAVLGARRPGVTAWNFVVAGLLAVLLLPVAEGLGDLRLNVFVTTFLTAALAVGLLNHLPTRLAAAVAPAGVACAVEACLVFNIIKGTDLPWLDPCALALLAITPWLGLAAARRRTAISHDFDREWLAFRDRFGAVWGMRLRDQFNRAAANAGWGVVLDWKGLRPAAADAAARRAEALTGLRAVLRRFGPEDNAPA
jgi:hypothetical protein